MSPLLENRFTFTEAALVAGITPKTLRNWLDRYGEALELDAEGEREGTGWRRFSLVDVIRMAFLAKLATLGWTIPEASAIVSAVLDHRLALLASYKNTPVQLIPATFHNLVLVTWRDSDGKPWHREGYAGDPLTFEPGYHAYGVVLLEGVLRDLFGRLDI